MSKQEWLKGLSPIQKAKIKWKIFISQMIFKARMFCECQLEVIKFIRQKKLKFIRRAMIEYYNTVCPYDLEITTITKARQDMERIKTVKQLNYWFNKALKWRIEQWLKA